MINAWEIYLVMQLDSIVAASGVVMGVSFAAMCVCIGMNFSDVPNALPLAKKIGLYACLPALFLATFLPSSKTAAAMIVLPAIVNNENVQREAGDLYRMAKEGLKTLVEPEEKGGKK